MPKPRLPSDDAEAQIQVIQLLLKTIQHFFGSIEQLFAEVLDPHESSHVIYPLPVMAFAGVLMFICCAATPARTRSSNNCLGCALVRMGTRSMHAIKR